MRSKNTSGYVRRIEVLRSTVVRDTDANTGHLRAEGKVSRLRRSGPTSSFGR
jgi:hypothetical protein